MSFDGVYAPMKAGDPVGQRAATAASGKIAKGPAGYKEVGCATVSFCDAEGKMLSAIRFARMPEPSKKGLKKSLLAELNAVLEKRPDLRVIKLADGIDDNWTFLGGEEMPPGPEAVDFYHAATHLHEALATVYGDGTVAARRRENDLRHVLRHEEDGVEKVIRALAYLARQHPKNKRVPRAVAYFRKHRGRMGYATLHAQGYPIGSGVVEAACKTLVTQRLKQSGMRWGREGGQAILELRGWTQSERFDQAWAMLVATYECEVTLLNRVSERPAG
jgi:hypothetical protein